MSNYSEEKLLEIWNKQRIPIEKYKDKYRKDACNAWIIWEEYGKQTEFGWEVDHILPEVKGGTKDIDNLRAFHWENNKSKGDDFPKYKCVITAYEIDIKNVKEENVKNVNKDVINRLKKLYPNNRYLKNL